ncbi:ABC transporter ATP-binding protein [Bhargavaea beijingensis]|uniref:ABC transporter ATP-binding protein n=1 Tax=Bhargavaea beijingensis TaxID=426756 RepID=A0ABX9ZC64_9BACL|nr:ABC transporter ATP-binding protein [Bhargavaea beijingensis]MCW1929341.1 ABC transporter ATP-binding protein [Bhargavaea beijingensis]RSK29754.1 ABC transporter ATP-binding protein [Bhargavaea beijingensis]
MIEFQNVSKQYGDGFKAVDSLDLEIKRGEFIALIGPSGCGKTTTLKMVNRLIEPTTGTILINGKNAESYEISRLRWNIGYVLQQIALFPHMSVEENIEVVPEMKRMEKRKVKQRTHELMEQVGLDPAVFAKRKPSELSGGQQQRVGVVRALAADPEILLMDEPFSALDPLAREKLQDDLLRLKGTFGKTTMFVTHDMNEALKLADRICLMREGKVVQTGTPDELRRNPAGAFVREFIGREQGSMHALLDLRQWVSAAPAAVPQTQAVVPAEVQADRLVSAMADHEWVAVEDGGTLIGLIDRATAFRLLAANGRGIGHHE